MAVTPSVGEHSFLVVIRTAGERTFDICRALVLRQVPDSQVRVVNQQPFAAALRSCLDIGLKGGVEWMVTVDADVLVRPGAIRDLLDLALTLPETHVQAEGLVHDKVWGGYRGAGHRVYRTRHLGEALAALAPDDSELRPESSMLERLSRRGFPSAPTNLVFGVHDYEQYHRDLYRKGHLQGRKFPGWLTEKVPEWRLRGEQDSDFRAIARGFCDGFLEVNESGNRSPGLEALASRWLAESGLSEKSSLIADADNLARVERELLQALPPELPARPGTRWWRMREARTRFGVFRMAPYGLGAILSGVGERLKRAAMRD